MNDDRTDHRRLKLYLLFTTFSAASAESASLLYATLFTHRWQFWRREHILKHFQDILVDSTITLSKGEGRVRLHSGAPISTWSM